MKACFVLQNQYAKLGHAMAVHLKERYSINDFCAYVISSGAANLVKQQTDIHYSSVLVDHELHSRKKELNLDIEFIKNFEQEYSPPPLWYYLYSDRKLMMSMGPKEETTTEIDPLYSHEELLLDFQCRAKPIEDMLKKERPDFILFFAVGSVGHMILYHVAKKLGIKTINIDFPRVGNSVCLSENYKTLTGVEKKFKDFMSNDAVPEKKEEAKEFIKNYRKTGSLKLEYYEKFSEVFLQKKSLLSPKNTLRSLKYILTLSKNYLNNRDKFTYGETNQHPLRFASHKLKRRYREIHGIDDLTCKPDFNEDYCFFPLHYEPELALLLLSPNNFDQLNLIRLIARSLPIHYKLYVKEHPAMKNRRPRRYYKELLKIPNVKLIEPTEKSFAITKHAKLIATITGTVGWEACLLGKPVITFGDVFYNVLSFVKRAKAMEDLPELISAQINNYAYNPEELINFTSAIMEDAVPFNFFDLWYENDFDKLKNDAGTAAICKDIIKKAKLL